MTEETEHTETEIPKKKRRWPRILLMGLNWFAVAGLLFACLAPLVSPAVFWPLAFFGLLHPAFVFANLLFLIWWIIRKRRQVFYSLFALMLSIPYYGKQVRIAFDEQEKAADDAFTVMSYNVKLFDLYNWSGNSATRAKMFTMIAEQKPDILSLQEFYNEDTGEFRNLDSLKQLLNLHYEHTEYTVTLRNTDHWGVVTLSRFPIVNTGKIIFNNRNNNICIYTDIVKNKDTIRVYNLHMQSVNFGYADYKFLNNIAHGGDSDSELESSMNILRRMKRAYSKRARQAESIKGNMLVCPYPVIVCGDFNDTPVSYTYRTLSSGLEDAFMESGRGFGKSFENPFPVPRIDYILHSPQLQSWEFKTLNDEALSDHFPVLCKVSVH